MTTSGDWDPQLYARFQAERSQPFYDLAGLVQRSPGMRVIDLGCGSGELTSWLHGEIEAASTLGVDSSEAMLAQARAHEGAGLSFAAGDIGALEGSSWAAEPYDLVLSNAALQWLPDHEALFARVSGLVAPGGQLAVQMPANEGHISHQTAIELAREAPFAAALGGYERPLTVLRPEEYALLLYRLGYAAQHVRLQIYTHVLPGPESVVEWVSGTFLTAFRARLDAPTYEAFHAEYARRLIAALEGMRPYVYTYPRVLIWGRKPAS